MALLQSLHMMAHDPQKLKRVLRHVKHILPLSNSFFIVLVTPSDSISALVSTDRMCCTSLSVSDKHSSDLPSCELSQMVAT